MIAAAGPARAFPWAEAQAVAFGLLRLSPRSFWEMTPRELASVMYPFVGQSRAPRRTDLETLMHAFPDAKEGDPEWTRR